MVTSGDATESPSIMPLPDLLARLDVALGRTRLSDRAASLKAGHSGDLIRNWRRLAASQPEGGARIRAEAIADVARAVGVAPEWLEHGEGDGPGEGLGSPGGLVPVPCFDLEARVMGEAFSQESKLFDLGVPRGMLRDLAAGEPADLALLRVQGDAMAPTLGTGDWVLVDRSRRAVGLGGLFLLRVGDRLALRRITPLPDPARLRVRGDNPSVEPLEIDAASLDVLGSAAWIGRRV